MSIATFVFYRSDIVVWLKYESGFERRAGNVFNLYIIHCELYGAVQKPPQMYTHETLAIGGACRTDQTTQRVQGKTSCNLSLFVYFSPVLSVKLSGISTLDPFFLFLFYFNRSDFAVFALEDEMIMMMMYTQMLNRKEKRRKKRIHCIPSCCISGVCEVRRGRVV